MSRSTLGIGARCRHSGCPRPPSVQALTRRTPPAIAGWSDHHRRCTMTRMRSLVLGSLVALAVTMTACGQAVDRLGNEAATPVVLHAETGFNPDEVAAYARQVARATGDLVRLDVAQAVAKTPAVEDDIIERVRSGALDAAFVGTRAW